MRAICDSMCAPTEPLLRPFQRILPMAGNLEISPLIVVLIELIEQVVIPNLARAVI